MRNHFSPLPYCFASKRDMQEKGPVKVYINYISKYLDMIGKKPSKVEILIKKNIKLKKSNLFPGDLSDEQ